jgi:hypothetical protein
MNQIIAYAICKNESANIDNFLKITKLVDRVYVLDTGSTDDSVNKLVQAGVVVNQKSYAVFDFAQARNDSLSMVEESNCFCFWLDFKNKIVIDDQAIQAVRSASRVNGFKVNHYYPSKEIVNSFIQIEDKIQIHRKEDYRWQFSIHEMLTYQGIDEEKVEKLNITVYNNERTSKEKISWYLDISERAFDRTRDVHYLWFMIGYYELLHRRQKFEESCYTFLSMTDPYKNPFRINIFHTLSKYFLEKNDRNRSIDFALHALSESISFRDSYPIFIENSMKLLKELNVEINIK